MTARKRPRHGNLKRLLDGLQEEADGLVERLKFGDNESVLAWFLHKYPDAIGRVVREKRWPEFLGLVRELYEYERDG